MADKLTPKQQQFAREYLVDFNATQAAIRAGYSEKTACEQGSRLLANVKVQAEIQRLGQKSAAKLEITRESIMRELAAMGFAHPVGKVKLPEKLRALELLGKAVGMFDSREAPAAAENNLFNAIADGTREEVDAGDIPELEQAAVAGDDVVEPPGIPAP